MFEADPTSLSALCGLAFLLGAKHGFDADHLAVIDGVSRLNAKDRPRLAQASGALFSLGHGAVVLVAVAAANLLTLRGGIPVWLELSGAVISVTFLIAVALLNLRAAFAPAQAPVRPVGFRAKWLANAPILTNPFGVAGTGALFAISFDTMTQAVLFAVIGAQLGGGVAALLAALCFVIGMVAIDCANGVWIAKLSQAANRRAIVASRVMALAVGVVSLAVCVFAVSKSILPAVSEWAEAHQFWFGASTLVVLTLSGLLALAFSPRRVEQSA